MRFMFGENKQKRLKSSWFQALSLVIGFLEQAMKFHPARISGFPSDKLPPYPPNALQMQAETSQMPH